MDEHVNYLYNKLLKLLGLLWRIRNNLDLKSKLLFYNSYVQPCIDYCCTVWGTCSKVHLDRLTRLQTRIGRLILNNYDSSKGYVFAQLGWLTVSQRVDYNILLLVFKCIHNMAPSNLQRLFENTSRKHNYLLRKSDISLELPKPRTEAMKRSFQYRGALLWNMLPTNICKIDDLQTFKNALKKHIVKSV